MSRFLSSAYASLEEYVPGEQPQDKKYIKLNTNESPYPPSPAVLEAVSSEEAEKLCLYSDPESKALKQALADTYGFLPENVFVSNGSDDILNFAFMAFGRADGVVYPDITYGFYKVFAQLHGLCAEVIPLSEDFRVSYKSYCSTGKMVVLANPNAPTGIALPLDAIEEIVASNPDHVVLIDEAYVDFGAESALPLIKKYKNLLVVQTFSKSRSMAGARLGYAFADCEIIRDLERIKYSTNPYNVNRITQAAGVAALSENEYYLANCQRIIKAREYTERALIDLGFTVLPSSANFVFAKHPEVGGDTIYKRLKEKGILVRHFGGARICEFNRITVGTMIDMQKMIYALKTIITEEKE